MSMPKIFMKEQIVSNNVHNVPNNNASAVVQNTNMQNIRPEYINELSQSLNKHGPSYVDAQIHSNIDSILQVHRRKMLRRAANRKSAQLSRARKKAHLEELKIENSRLQRLVDILDSQPELVFCVTVKGKLTYVSERTINFVKINMFGEDSDEDPTHISQILSETSVTAVLEAIHQLSKYTSNQLENESNMVFSSKEVYFHDAFGHPLVGYLRCSKVFRRTTLQELQHAESAEDINRESNSISSSVPPPPSKKVRLSKGSSSTTSQSNEQFAEDWNLANFKILTDCVSSLTGEETSAAILTTSVSNNANSPFEQSMNYAESKSAITVESFSSKETETKNDQPQSPNKTNTDSANQSSSSDDDEYICVIRTSEDCFIPHTTPSSNLFMFSSILSTASVVAHDLGLRSNTTNVQEHSNRRGSPNGSSGSNNSSGGQPNSDSSKETKNSTSSETGSEDNSAETDSN